MLSWSPSGLCRETESYLLAIHSNPNISLLALSSIEGESQITECYNFTHLIKGYSIPSKEDINDQNQHTLVRTTIDYYHLYGCWNDTLFKTSNANSLPRRYSFLYLSVGNTIHMQMIYENQIEEPQPSEPFPIQHCEYIQQLKAYCSEDKQTSLLYCLTDNNQFHLLQHSNTPQAPLTLLCSFNLSTLLNTPYLQYQYFVSHQQQLLFYNTSSLAVFQLHHDVDHPYTLSLLHQHSFIQGIHLILPNQFASSSPFILFDLKMNCYELDSSFNPHLLYHCIILLPSLYYLVDTSSTTLSSTVMSYALSSTTPYHFYYQSSKKKHISTLPVLNNKMMIHVVSPKDPQPFFSSIIQTVFVSFSLSF